MVLLSGREPTVMSSVLEKLRESGADSNYVALMQKAFSKTISRHIYRGYAILESDHPVVTEMYDVPERRPLWLVFSGMGSQWAGMGAALMKIPVAAESIRRSAAALAPHGVDLIHIVTSTDPSACENILHAFVGIAAIQVALTNILRCVGLEVDGMIGHSTGELACGYADGCLTNEQTVLSAFARGKASLDAKPPKGMMAAVGLGYQNIKDKLPEGIYVACHNSSTSCTLTGPADLMETYIAKLKADGVFAKLVNVSNIAYHSKYIAAAGPYLLKYLKDIIPDPKERSSKWISSSVQDEHWDEPLAKYCSPEYQTNNLLSSVYFEEAMRHIPADAVLIEVAPHGLMQAILKRALPKCKHIPLTSRLASDPLVFLLDALGRAYVNGVDLDLSQLYPSVAFPVPLNTKSFQDVVSWNHSEKYNYAFYVPEKVFKPDENSRGSLTYNSEDKEIFDMFKEYIVNGTSIVPYGRILADALRMYAGNRNVDFRNLHLQIQDLKFENAVEMTDKVFSCNLTLMASGTFQVTCGTITVMSGKINDIPENSHHFGMIEPTFEKTTYLDSDEIYDFFEENGHVYNGPFASLQSLSISDKGFIGRAKVMDKEEYLIEAVFSSVLFFRMYDSGRPGKLSKVGQLILNTSLLLGDGEFTLVYDAVANKISTKGMTMINCVAETLPMENKDTVTLKQREFVPYGIESTFQEQENFFDICCQFVVENTEGQLKEGDSLITSAYIVGNRTKNTQFNQMLAQYCYVQCRALSLKEMLAETWKNNEAYIITYEGEEVPFQIKTRLSYPSSYLLLYTSPSSNAPEGFTVIYRYKSADFSMWFVQNLTDARSSSDITEPEILVNEKTYIIEEFNGIKYVFVDNEPLSQFVSMVEQYPHSDTRFTYLENGYVDSDKFKSILSNGFKSTVVRDGVPGSIRYFPVKSSMPKSTNQILFWNDEDDDVNVQMIGVDVNMKNISQKKIETEIVEYSGFKDGTRVMGLASIVEGRIQTDPTLQWHIPRTWTLEQAATVPLHYCLAYHGLHQLGKVISGETVYISAAASSLGRAASVVASSLGCKVFAFISSADENNIFVKEISQLPGVRLVRSQSAVMRATKGKGVDVAVFTGGSLEVALDLLTEYSPRGFGGRLVQMDIESMKLDQIIGMEVFFKKTGVAGLPPNALLHLKSEEKDWLRQQISQGLHNGHISPSEGSVLNIFSSEDFSNSTLKKKPLPHGKILIDIKEEGRGNGKNNRSALIVGNHRSLWFNILCRLASKGVYYFHLVVDEDLVSPFLLGRMRRFLHSRTHIKVYFHPVTVLSSDENRNALLSHLRNFNVESVIFFPSEDRYCISGMASLLNQGLPESSVVTIGKRADCVRERLGNRGVALLCHPRVAIRRLLSALDLLHSSPPVVAIPEVIEHTPEEVEGVLPETVELLLELENVTSSKVILRPLLTRGVSNVMDSMPIIVIPGLQVSQLIGLARQFIYPAWLVTFPTTIASLLSLAESIAQVVMKQWPQLKVATLLCEGWSGLLALWVARQLELRGHQVIILGIDASPYVFQSKIRDITALKLLCKYFDMDQQTFEQLRQNDVWDSKLEIAAKDSTPALRECVNALASRLQLAHQFDKKGFALDAKVILIRPASANKFDFCGLEQMCSRPVQIRQVSDGDMFGKDCLHYLQSYILYQLDEVRPGRRDIESMAAYINLDQLLMNLNQSVTQNH